MPTSLHNEGIAIQLPTSFRWRRAKQFHFSANDASQEMSLERLICDFVAFDYIPLSYLFNSGAIGRRHSA